MNGARDGEGAAMGDGNFVRTEEHHSMRRRQGEGGLLQFDCRTQNDLNETLIMNNTWV